LVRKRLSPVLKKAACEVLLLCITADIPSENKERLSGILAEGIDWEYLLNLVEFHGVVPLVAHNLITDDFRDYIPEPYLDRLDRVYNRTLYRNVLLSNELNNILAAFSRRGIAVIPLKGTILAEVLYGNPALRAIADMDILVHPEDIPQAGSLLGELGYKKMPEKPQWDHRFHEVPYYKQAAFPLFLELHWDLEDRRLVTIPEKKIWHRSQMLELQGISTTVLSPEDNLLFLSIHCSKQSGELSKYLGDIAELLKKHQDTLDWDYIIASARSWQTDVTVYYALRRAKDLLGAPVPVSALETLKPSFWRRWLLGFLINQEDFVIPIRTDRLRAWTSVLARGLMMKYHRQTLAVLSRHQGSYKRGAWLRTTFWVTLVLAAAVWRNGIRLVSK